MICCGPQAAARAWKQMRQTRVIQLGLYYLGLGKDQAIFKLTKPSNQFISRSSEVLCPQSNPFPRLEGQATVGIIAASTGHAPSREMSPLLFYPSLGNVWGTDQIYPGEIGKPVLSPYMGEGRGVKPLGGKCCNLLGCLGML